MAAHQPAARTGRDRRREPHPVRPLQLDVRAGVQPGHAHRRRSTAWSPASGCRASRLGEVVAGAVLKHSRDFNLTRESVLGSQAVGRRRRPTTSSRPAAPAWRRPSWSPTRSRSGQIESGIAGGVDTTSDAPLAVNDDLRRVLISAEQRQDAAGPAQGAGAASGPASWCRRSRATPSRAPACRWASTRRSPPRSGRSAARSRTSWPSARTRTSPPPTTAASSTTWSRPTSA